MKLISIDIDGVLNRHEQLPSGVCGISPDLRDNFNRIIDAHPDVRVLLHSAWRYLVVYIGIGKERSDMTLEGMGYLLQTHGLKMYDLENQRHRLIGCTDKDVYQDGAVDRPLRIREWIENSGTPITRLAILDDLKLNWDGPEFFQCNRNEGLTPEIADRVIVHLGGNS